MSMTLRELIGDTLDGLDVDELDDMSAGIDFEADGGEKTAGVPVDLEDVEKLASVAEFVGLRGVATMVKEATTPGTNEGSRPGGGREVSTSGLGSRSHHPALASNESARAYNKKVKARQEGPQLSAVLDTTPFADPELKKLLDHTEGDKNINSSKRAHDRGALRAEIAHRLMRKQEAASA